MSVSPVGTPFSDVIGFEGIGHGKLPQVVGNLGVMGYGFVQAPNSPASVAAPAPEAPQPSLLSLDF